MRFLIFAFLSLLVFVSSANPGFAETEIPDYLFVELEELPPQQDFAVVFDWQGSRYKIERQPHARIEVARNDEIIYASGESATQAASYLWRVYGHLVIISGFGAHSQKVEVLRLRDAKMLFSLVHPWGVGVNVHCGSPERPRIQLKYESDDPAPYANKAEAAKDDAGLGSASPNGAVRLICGEECEPCKIKDLPPKGEFVRDLGEGRYEHYKIIELE